MADNKDEIVCPACGQTMKKVFINSIGKHIDICLKECGGIFFDNREFEKVDEKHENIEEILELYKDWDIRPAQTNNDVRICSFCNSQMVKQNAQGVIIDVCYTCGAKFLDYGELETYRAQYATEEERSKAFAKVMNQALKTGEATVLSNEVLTASLDNNYSQTETHAISKDYEYEQVEAPTYSNGQMDEIIYSEPPKGFLPRLATYISNKFRF